jgi:hypothetical protein
MWTLLTLPFKIASMLLRSALGIIGILFNPFILFVVACVVAFAYFA